MQYQDQLQTLVAKALKKQAEHAEALIVCDASTDVSCRLQKIEHIESSESVDLGLRVFIDGREAIVSTSSLDASGYDDLVDQVLAMARASTQEPFSHPADATEIANSICVPESFDKTQLSAESMGELALKAEQAALDYDGIQNSDGANCSAGSYNYTLCSSNGFTGSFQQSYYALSTAVLAGEGTQMQGDYAHSVTVFYEDLKDPDFIGKEAAERTLKMLGPRKIKSGTYPVLFDPRVGTTLLRSLAGAINGQSIVRKTSYLQDYKGKKIFPENVTIIDNPHLKRGLGSRPFDAEGLENQALNIVEKGVLQNWLTDLSTSRQLDIMNTARASRSTSSRPRPGTTNFYLEAGQASVEDLIKEMGTGFYVTSTMGMGVNPVTGEYSQGASGLWIENGEIVYPVQELTIAGQILDMFKDLVPANDLQFRYSTNMPHVLIPQMTVAGS